VIEKLKTAFKLWLEYVIHFPKLHRYTFGAKIHSLFLDILELVFTAIYLPKEQKSCQLVKAVSKLDLLKFFLQLAWEAKMLDNNKYLALSACLIEIGRMLGGWQKQLKK